MNLHSRLRVRSALDVALSNVRSSHAAAERASTMAEAEKHAAEVESALAAQVSESARCSSDCVSPGRQLRDGCRGFRRRTAPPRQRRQSATRRAHCRMGPQGQTLVTHERPEAGRLQK